MTEITDAAGAIVEKYEYDVFGRPYVFDGAGNPLTESAVGNPYLFTGRRYDQELGLYYYRARYYAPEIGRFLSTDPLGYFDGPNLYTYCHNNPINLVDASGLAPGDWWDYRTPFHNLQEAWDYADKQREFSPNGSDHHAVAVRYFATLMEESYGSAIGSTSAVSAAIYGTVAEALEPSEDWLDDMNANWLGTGMYEEDVCFPWEHDLMGDAIEALEKALDEGDEDTTNGLLDDLNNLKELNEELREEVKKHVMSHPWKYEGDERFGRYERRFTGDPNRPGWRQRDKWEDVWIWDWE